MIQNKSKGLKKETSIRLKLKFVDEASFNADETKDTIFNSFAP